MRRFLEVLIGALAMRAALAVGGWWLGVALLCATGYMAYIFRTRS